MSSPLVYIAAEPRAYRETIGLAMRAMRPGACVLVIEPIDLDAKIARQPPDLALCTTLSATVAAAVPTWVLLYPDGAETTVISDHGQQRTTSALALDDLAALVGSA
jgi:hypothetical protein